VRQRRIAVKEIPTIVTASTAADHHPSADQRLRENQITLPIVASAPPGDSARMARSPPQRGSHPSWTGREA
jgi:hypothetical protein